MDNQQVSYSKVYKIHNEYPQISVSNTGDVITTKTGLKRYTRVNKQGYVVTQVEHNKKIRTLKVHRLVADLFLTPPSEELLLKCSLEHHGKVIVRHLDNDKTNNDVTNLVWSDQKTNTQQAWDDGLIPSLKGECNGRSTLTDSIVHEICLDYQNGLMPKQVVAKYGISQQQATKIRAGIQWKHVWCNYDIKVNRRIKTSTISPLDVGSSDPKREAP